MQDERGGDVILRGERVGGTKHDLCAAGLQRAHQVGCLRGDVQASSQAQAGQWLFSREALCDGA